MDCARSSAVNGDFQLFMTNFMAAPCRVEAAGGSEVAGGGLLAIKGRGVGGASLDVGIGADGNQIVFKTIGRVLDLAQDLQAAAQDARGILRTEKQKQSQQDDEHLAAAGSQERHGRMEHA